MSERISLSEVSAATGIPEERLALMATRIREDGIEDAHMGQMMRVAAAGGIDPERIVAMLESLGVSCEQATRVASAQGLLEPEAARALLERSRSHESVRENDDKSLPHIWRRGAIIGLWLVVWQIADAYIHNRLILTGPLRAVTALSSLAMKAEFWLACSASLIRIASGFFLSVSIGILLAVVAHRSRLVRDLVEPVMSLLRTIPVVSIIIMLLIWVGNQLLMVYLAFTVVLPFIYTGVLAGLDSADPEMLEVARIFGISKWRVFLYIYRPACMAHLTSACKLGLGMSWKSGIMAEVLAVPKPSVGKGMALARTYLNTPDLFAWTLVVMLMSWIFELGFMALLRRLSLPFGSLLVRRSHRACETGRPASSSGDVAQSYEASEGSAELVLTSVSKSFGAQRVLSKLDMSLAAGSLTCLMGPSGAGKTTLLRIILGLERIDAGQISNSMPGSISVVFQEDRLAIELTPIENVALVMGGRASYQHLVSVLSEILPPECLNRPVSQLSGGQRRRVALARAVLAPSSMIVMDEPFTGLDAATRQEVIRFVLRHRACRTLLVSTHGEQDAELLGATRLNMKDLSPAL
ncbi:ATP-binding cassette domain-containing protein [Collinsella sp. AGMB00827]|uniref:ATP-binding cassette domain-containing protein n=1 Tax=Collinsella ureilytica TaxID=2869515 RepID=A0ABS7MME3_9ACTN|nr:ATP-binding cassette domain-containing protein [Collinsella urealyticum]MBY4798265.1 ATP-binding cassette domain-containing protein [Collinsella urealyticum]